MRPGQSLNALTARLLAKLDRHYAERAPRLVLGHGDTNTCFAAALAAFYRGIPFFHVEAGLRSGNIFAPYPEEFNRRSVAPLAHHHYAPTPVEKENLRAEGIDDSRISVTGSTIADAVGAVDVRATGSGATPAVLVTLHRRESAGAFAQILSEISELAARRPDLPFLCPLHPSPAVREQFRGLRLANVQLTEPLPYPEFLAALRAAPLVITDSGGVQEEAALLGRPVILARSETERRDGIAEGLVHLSGGRGEKLKDLADSLLRSPPVVTARTERRRASALIARHVAEAL